MSELLTLKQNFLKYSHPIRKTIINNRISYKSINSNDVNNSSTNESDILQPILDSMFPIKLHKSDDYILEEHVSTVPSTRSDVLSLKECLDTALQTYEARETGICPIRRQLYDQCFDEIIRQVSVNCVDRGLLLYNVRNEIRMTISSLNHMRESGVAFGLRNALKSNVRDIQIENSLLKLKEENAELIIKLEKSQKDLHNLTEDKNEIISLLNKNHEEEVKRLKTIIHQQRMLIESLKRKPIKF